MEPENNQRRNTDHFNLLCDMSELTTILADSKNIAHFLRQTARMVARHLHADVCSIYLFDDQRHELVLRATIGLNPASEGKVRLKSGEGLVGMAMLSRQPVCEGFASSSRHFKYFEETGEERFESFLAVPIIRGIENIGVLVVQHSQRDYFDETDMMALKATASQLAGAIENARLLMDMAETPQRGACVPESLRFVRGRSASSGFALAPCVKFEKAGALLFDDDLTEAGSHLGMAEFQEAFHKTLEQLKTLQDRFAQRLPESASLIFTAHFMILKDSRFHTEIMAKIQAGMDACRAVKAVTRHYIAMFSASPYLYLREKVIDMQDLGARLIENLMDRNTDSHGGLQHRIVIAKELYPSDILKLASQDVAGIVLVSGGITSHVSILAQSLQIPTLIVDKPDLLTIPDNTPVLMDADIGNLYVDPSQRILKQFEERNSARVQASRLSRQMEPATCTADGERVHLYANINLLSELPLANQLLAEGIGLYRSEFPFIIRSNFPSEEEQYQIYKRLIEQMPGKPVVIRTLDIGGDKVLAYSDSTGEANPELGLRSIRFSLQNTEIFEQQIRAVLRAGADHPDVGIMFPMICSLDELREAKTVVLRCIADLSKNGLSHQGRIRIGMMVELPSVIPILDELAAESDFLSIGTNDFVQYMLAVDRTNEKVAQYYQPGHPAVLRGLHAIVQAAIRQGKPVSVCGELAHEPEYIAFLIGIGVRRLSVNPQYLPHTQQIIRQLELRKAQSYASTLLCKATVRETSEILMHYREYLEMAPVES
ncbi:phosphoenolpyruvate--protein phosphotransferase [Desulfatirhabdium butyrativorans]|uniref:phosphoenolpyruvate--protein phosphotransferase n=1 Tax=Desulfatirhabdium butyrativorans TaxID=340467 RepID=UPI000414DCEA|nr:phosphoenolpyruvate--protein phosphotransferase [Desulfatirhabdium butyrativorans]